MIGVLATLAICTATLKGVLKASELFFMISPLLEFLLQYMLPVVMGILIGLFFKMYFAARVQNKIRIYQVEIVKTTPAFCTWTK
jgi:hypothetical protein